MTAPIERILAGDSALNALNPQPFPVPVGNLAPVIAGALAALSRGDWWVPGLRERVGAVLRDVPVERLVDGFAGAKPYKVAPALGAHRATVAVGLAAANRGQTTLVHLGIGAAADGSFAEALNLAALTRVNCIFVVAVDPLGEGAPLGPQLLASPAALAAAFGVGARVVDGRDMLAVETAVRDAKAAGGPWVIEAWLAASVS